MDDTHLTGERARRRRALHFLARVFVRQFLLRIVTPAMITAWPVLGMWYWLGLGDFTTLAYLETVEHGIAGLAIFRWWQAVRTAALARQLYLDTRHGPLGTGGTTR